MTTTSIPLAIRIQQYQNRLERMNLRLLKEEEKALQKEADENDITFMSQEAKWWLTRFEILKVVMEDKGYL